MGQWRKNLNARQRKNSRKPRYDIAVLGSKDQDLVLKNKDGVHVDYLLRPVERVYDKPCYCNEDVGSEPGHTHVSAPQMEQPK